MRLAFSKPTSAPREQEDLFSGFRAAGYDGLQLKGGQYVPYLDEPERFRAEWGAIPGVASALIYGGVLDGPGQNGLRRVIKFAQTVGAERIVFCHGQSRVGLTANDLREYARVLSGLGDEARQQGVALSLHHHEGQPVMHRADFDTFFDAVTPGSVGLTVDIAHLVKSGLPDIAGLLRDLRGVIDNIHLKDYADGEWAVLGRGQINFAPVFAALGDIGYDGWLCADEESGSALIDSLAECHRFLSRHGAKKAPDNL